ncbi:biopolymer transporter ExbD [Pararhodobacter zhoushanensis]|uniref:biopolymer transporter ExbD n=1 Tax=Pararhodobacter zhoushanensis TaxID=2479545 RepID=UPI000F8F1291|nr:biopolymer transporter ExbD [Pararhodobacter zhoushanensis]
MTLRRRQPAPIREPLLPMINVAVLLLILLAVSARLEPADPLPVSLPSAEGERPPDGLRLFVAADGTLALGEARGEDVFSALEPDGNALRLHVDSALPGSSLVALLNRLNAAGFEQTQLVVLRP